MDQNQESSNQNHAAPAKKFHDPYEKSHAIQGSGDKHYATVRAVAFRDGNISALTKLNSSKRMLTDECNKYAGKIFGDLSINASVGKATSSFSKTKQLLEQCSKNLNTRPRKRQLKVKHYGENSMQTDAAPLPSSCVFVDETKSSLPVPVTSVKAACVCNQSVIKENALEAALRQSRTEPISKNHDDRILRSNDATASLQKSESPVAFGTTQTPREIYAKNPEIKMEENLTPTLPGNEGFTQQHHWNNYQQQQQPHSLSMQYLCDHNVESNHFINPNNFSQHPSLPNPGHHVNHFSCSNFIHRSVPQSNLNSEYDLRRSCTRPELHCPSFWNPTPQVSQIPYATGSQFCEIETPDITIENTGKCVINTLCLAADANGRYLNIQGFELAFYQSNMSGNGFNGSIRMDFSTLGFLDPNSFETEIDDKGNIFVSGNIFGAPSKLWVSLPHCPNPDTIAVENPAPYSFTIMIPISAS